MLIILINIVVNFQSHRIKDERVRRDNHLGKN